MLKPLCNLILFICLFYISSGMVLAATDATQVTPAQVQAIIGKVMVKKYNTARTSAALIGKTFVGTLEVPKDAANGGAANTNAITTKALGKASIYFACKDFPNGFSTKMPPLNVSAKIIKFETGYEGDSDDFATVTLDQCRTNVTKTAVNQLPAFPPESNQPKNPAQPTSTNFQKTIDEQFNARKSAECASGFNGLICYEKIRFALSSDKWSENPTTGQSVCKMNNMK